MWCRRLEGHGRPVTGDEGQHITKVLFVLWAIKIISFCRLISMWQRHAHNVIVRVGSLKFNTAVADPLIDITSTLAKSLSLVSRSLQNTVFFQAKL